MRTMLRNHVYQGRQCCLRSCVGSAGEIVNAHTSNRGDIDDGATTTLKLLPEMVVSVLLMT